MAQKMFYIKSFTTSTKAAMFSFVSLFSWFVSRMTHKTTERISMKLGWRMDHSPTWATLTSGAILDNRSTIVYSLCLEKERFGYFVKNNNIIWSCLKVSGSAVMFKKDSKGIKIFYYTYIPYGTCGVHGWYISMSVTTYFLKCIALLFL